MGSGGQGVRGSGGPSRARRLAGGYGGWQPHGRLELHSDQLVCTAWPVCLHALQLRPLDSQDNWLLQQVGAVGHSHSTAPAAPHSRTCAAASHPPQRAALQ